jgi:hypothetical protein
MQTFLPYSDFIDSAKVLDVKRLGKQRVESWQLLIGQWHNHPASKMWRGYELALAYYGLIICHEWIRRGYRDSMKSRFLFWISEHSNENLVLPPWIFGPIHANHRGRLLAKNFEYYNKFQWREQPVEENFWPI